MSDLVGRRVRLEHCSDPYTRLEPGTEGTVSFVDSMGTLHVDWDTGSKLGLVADAGDRWTVLADPDAELVAAVVANYDREVRANRSPDWDTLTAVATDTHGEVVWEAIEAAEHAGLWPERDDEESDALVTKLRRAIDAYRAGLRRELNWEVAR